MYILGPNWTEIMSRTHEWQQVSLCSAWRCDKVMDIYSGCALCLPNLTYPVLYQPTHTPPLCIEIKVLGLAAFSRFCNTGSHVLKLWFFGGCSLEDVWLVRAGRQSGCNITRLCDCDCNSVSVRVCVFVCVLWFQPKCGFLPSSKHVSKDIKTKVCRFCMHQLYKVTQPHWKCQ